MACGRLQSRCQRRTQYLAAASGRIPRGAPAPPLPAEPVAGPPAGRGCRDIAASQGITERSAHAIVADLTQAGYVVKRKAGRRNRYQIEAHLPLAEPGTREPAVGEVLDLLLGHVDRGDGPPALAVAE
jgi:hypothetical protein